MLQFLLNVPEAGNELMKAAPHENAPKYVCGLPYSTMGMNPIQYISGGFITIKTDVMRAVPFDETLYQGDAEDVEWSERLVYNYSLKTEAWRNTNCDSNNIGYVKVQKPNKWAVIEMPRSVLTELRTYYGL